MLKRPLCQLKQYQINNKEIIGSKIIKLKKNLSYHVNINLNSTFSYNKSLSVFYKLECSIINFLFMSPVLSKCHLLAKIAVTNVKLLF